MGHECKISEPFKREHKRKRASEFEQRARLLQERLSASYRPNFEPLAGRAWPSVNSVESARDSRSAERCGQSGVLPSSSFQSTSATVDESHVQQDVVSDDRWEPTVARTINGQSVDPADIDQLFDHFRTAYAPQLPFLDPLKSPNAQYASSPFLFWAIIGVGCRTYARNPTLLAVLAPAVLAAALSTLNSPVTLQTIQGLLTLLHWPFPKTSATSDLLYPLTGALINMAMQIGLHLPISAQEFSKVRLCLDTAEIERRARTWGFCQLIHLRSGVPKGSPAPAVFDIPYDLDERRIMFDNLSAEQKFELKLQDIVNRCCIAASQNGLRVMTSDRERSLDTLLAMFSAQVASIGLDASSDLDRFYVQLAHLCVQSLHLYKSPGSQDPTILFDLSNTCCQVLEFSELIDKASHNGVATSSMWIYINVMLACHVLLRLLKSSLSCSIDTARAQAAFFSGVGLHKRMSLQNDDLSARNGVALTQIWNSTRAFRSPNGSEAVALRVRSRLIGGIILDGIVWWREEFGEASGIYAPPLLDRDGFTCPSTFLVRVQANKRQMCAPTTLHMVARLAKPSETAQASMRLRNYSMIPCRTNLVGLLTTISSPRFGTTGVWFRTKAQSVHQAEAHSPLA
ncbi:hypothetical protein, variant 1 [Exophiala mesophila]|uniref:Xylanolytic transcriptional activator regulatory domain-containing protein n=1 Tax=Exophiala mesophila TaxID=212818 RepID=A0A0D1ZHR9_EXOME|nr:hypothetical protein, variant 1 [Exophiala mesophila]KIV94162.1 hypothetical protein, variant 1 [Exophiala mesophila]